MIFAFFFFSFLLIQSEFFTKNREWARRGVNRKKKSPETINSRSLVAVCSCRKWKDRVMSSTVNLHFQCDFEGMRIHGWLRALSHFFYTSIRCYRFYFIFRNRTFPAWGFSRRLDGRVKHRCRGRLHCRWQWRTEIDLSPHHKFPESFPAQRISWERVQAFCFLFFSLFSIFRTFFLFLVGQHARMCNALW